MVKEINLSFPILRDPKGKIARSWGTAVFPESYIVGTDGVIVDKILGIRDWTGRETISAIEKFMEPAEL